MAIVRLTASKVHPFLLLSGVAVFLAVNAYAQPPIDTDRELRTWVTPCVPDSMRQARPNDPFMVYQAAVLPSGRVYTVVIQDGWLAKFDQSVPGWRRQIRNCERIVGDWMFEPADHVSVVRIVVHFKAIEKRNKLPEARIVASEPLTVEVPFRPPNVVSIP